MTEALLFLAVLFVSLLTLACCAYLLAVLYRVASAWMGEEDGE